MTRAFTIVPLGPFALRESALFGFGQRMRPAGVGDRDAGFDGVMRLAFCLDGTDEQVGVEVRQDDEGVHGVVHGDAGGSTDAVRDQVARVLSLDHDARGYVALADADPVVARLQAAAPGLRPPLFYSPYEAAAWSVLSARRPGWQMDRVRTDLSRAHGATFTLAGETLAALPTPRQLLAIEEFPRIDAPRLERLHGVARAALDGVLDVAVLRGMEPDDAMRHVQQIKGIGPLYSSLIVIRALGLTDVLPEQEPRFLDLVRRLYDLPAAPDAERLRRLAEPWRPWRTWVAVLMRSSAERVLDS